MSNTSLGPEKILIIRLSSIGDIILSYPLLMELNDKYPDCEIDYLIAQKYQDLLYPIRRKLHAILTFNKNRGPAQIIKYRRKIKDRNYDWILDLHNKPRSWILTIFTAAKTFRVNKYQIKRWLYIKFSWDIYPEIPVYQKYFNTAPVELQKTEKWYFKDCRNEKIKNRLSDKHPVLNQSKPVILIFPGAKHKTKQWPLKNYFELINKIIKQTDWIVILSGDKHDARAINKKFENKRIINTCGKYNLIETMCLVSLCDMIISNDSGPMHMAAVFHKPQIAIFGSTVPRFGFSPYNDKALIIENKNLKCRPCSHIGYDKCPRDHFKCMRAITVPHIFRELSNLTKLLNN
jgi:heptosyltransferase-2